MIAGYPTWWFIVGGGVIALTVVIVSLWYTGALSGKGKDPEQVLFQALQAIRGDADLVALLPYDDGTFYMKPANFDKELIGGQGGYETEDGDKIVLDGDGEPVKSLFGVDVLLAVDPTEHAGAVDPVKALMAQKNNMGEWIKVDRQGDVIEAGEALTPAPTSDVEVGPEGTAVEAEAQQMMQEQGVPESVAMERALQKLEKEGEVTKVMDLAPMAAPVVDDEGNVGIEEASHIAVDQSKGADLMPTTTSTVELNTALDKARMEEYEEGRLTKYLVYGIVIGFLAAILSGGAFIGINAVI
jgi:hypothetical protein